MLGSPSQSQIVYNCLKNDKMIIMIKMSMIVRGILIFTDNIASHAREIKINFLGNLNCWLKQISSLPLPVPHSRHTEDLGRSNKIFLELSEIQWNKFYGPWKENFTRNENLPTDPRITRTTLHYNVLNWSVSFISSSLCSNEFILPLGRELISFQINLSK